MLAACVCRLAAPIALVGHGLDLDAWVENPPYRLASSQYSFVGWVLNPRVTSVYDGSESNGICGGLYHVALSACRRSRGLLLLYGRDLGPARISDRRTGTPMPAPRLACRARAQTVRTRRLMPSPKPPPLHLEAAGGGRRLLFPLGRHQGHLHPRVPPRQW